MNKVYKQSKKERAQEALCVTLWIYLFLFIASVVIYILQLLYLEPDPGSTYEQDIIKALLVDIFCPLSIALFVFLASYIGFLQINDETRIEYDQITLTKTSALTGRSAPVIKVNINDITYVKRSCALFWVGKKDISVIVSRYEVNNKIINKRAQIYVSSICTKEERNEFIDYLKSKDIIH